MSKLISLLPEDIKSVALQRQRDETGKCWGKNTDELEWAFNWGDTPEKHDIWEDVHYENYAPFRAFHANLKQSENGWTSVSERVPETSDNVLIYNNKTAMQGLYYKGTWYTYENYVCHPTHWQPLPPPPAKH